MAGMRELLEEMVSKGASDLHLAAGLPPQYRIDGQIVSTDLPVLTGATWGAGFISNAMTK